MNQRKGNLQENITYKPHVVSEISKKDDYDVFIISGKSNTLLGTLSEFNQVLPDKTVLLIFQTLWQSPEEFKNIIPNKIIYGFPHVMGGGKDENGIYCTIFGSKNAPTMLGEKDGSTTKILQEISDIFLKADMNPQISKNILGWIYTHYAEASGLLSGIMQTDDYINFAKDRNIMKLILHAIREGLEVCEKRGIEVKKIKPQCYYFLPDFIMVPIMSKMYSSEGAKLMVKGHLSHSLDEMKDMTNSIIESAKQCNVDTPTYNLMKDKVNSFTL